MLRRLPTRALLALVSLGPSPTTAQHASAPAQQATAPELRPQDLTLPARKDAPLLACTPEELARLRSALASAEPAVTKIVDRARRRLREQVVFPPRGGQHNQWYQCEECQLGLETLTETRHRCPKCKLVYTGPPYDDVIFSRVHGQNWTRAREAAWSYVLTGDAALRDDAKAIVLGYAARYEKYPYHTNSKGGLRKGSGGGHIKEQSLSEASLMIDSIVPACDLLWPALSQDERTTIREHLIRPMLQNLERAPRGMSNWQSFHNAAMFAGGALIGELRWMRRSIFHKTNGFLFQMGRCVSSEGMWYENSWGYHIYTLRALTAHAEYARRCGIDLWHQGPLQRMVALPLAYTMPDGGLPRFGDDVNSRISHRTGFVQAARPVFDTPALRMLAQGPATWESILHGNETGPVLPVEQTESRIFEGAGHAILRNSGTKGLCTTITFGRFGGFHGHFDKLGFVFHAYGREYGVDPGRARSQAYRLPAHKLWYRATIAHNAVVVDGRSQHGTSGKLLLFVPGRDVQAVAASVEHGYKDLRHARCLVQTKDFLLVLDDLVSTGGKRRFDWIYHNRGRTFQSEQSTGKPDGDLGMTGQRFVELETTGTTQGAMEAELIGKQHRLLLRMADPGTETGTRIYTGTGPGKSVLDRVPLVLLRREGTRATFACLLEPVRSGQESTIRDFRAGKKGGEWEVRIQTTQRLLKIRWDGAISLSSGWHPLDDK